MATTTPLPSLLPAAVSSFFPHVPCPPSKTNSMEWLRRSHILHTSVSLHLLFPPPVLPDTHLTSPGWQTPIYFSGPILSYASYMKPSLTTTPRRLIADPQYLQRTLTLLGAFKLLTLRYGLVGQTGKCILSLHEFSSCFLQGLKAGEIA